MSTLFATAKLATDIPAAELERLFIHPAYEPRLAAFCILDFRARRRLSAKEREDLAAIYLDHHDAITTWDMVDRAAPRVIGWPILSDVIEFRVLEDLARSDDPLRRRSAITAPLWFIKKGTDGDVARGLVIADLLADDPHPRVAAAVKIYRKHAARRDQCTGQLNVEAELHRVPTRRTIWRSFPTMACSGHRHTSRSTPCRVTQTLLIDRSGTRRSRSVLNVTSA